MNVPPPIKSEVSIENHARGAYNRCVHVFIYPERQSSENKKNKTRDLVHGEHRRRVDPAQNPLPPIRWPARP